MSNCLRFDGESIPHIKSQIRKAQLIVYYKLFNRAFNNEKQSIFGNVSDSIFTLRKNIFMLTNISQISPNQ